MAPPQKSFGYSDYRARHNDDSYVRPPTGTINVATQSALDELEVVANWTEFVKLCVEQKAKRGY